MARCKVRCGGARALRRLRKHIPPLRILKDAHPGMRSGIIKSADDELLQTLSECSLNVLHANQPLSPRCKKLLARHKSVLRKLAAPPKTVSFRYKRRLLSQKGGFLGILLSTLLGGLLNRFV